MANQTVTTARIRVGVDDQTSKGFARVKSSVKTVAKGLGIFSAAAAAASVGTFALARAGGIAATELNVQARQFKLTGQQVLEYKAAVEEAGGSSEKLERTLRTFNQRVGETIFKNIGPLKDSMETLGLTYEDLDEYQQDSDFAMRDFIRRLSELDSEMVRTGIGVTVFGRGFRDLYNAVESGTLDSVTAEFAALGVQLDQQIIDNAERANSAWDRMLKATGVLTLQFRAGLAPVMEAAAAALTNLAPKLTEVTRGFTEWSKSVAETIVLAKVAETIIPRAVAAVRAAMSSLYALLAKVAAIAVTIAAVIFPIVRGFGVLAKVATRTGSALTAVRAALTALWEGMKRAVRGILQSTIAKLGVFTAAWHYLGDAMSRVLKLFNLNTDFGANFKREIDRSGVAIREAAAQADVLTSKIDDLQKQLAVPMPASEGLLEPLQAFADIQKLDETIRLPVIDFSSIQQINSLGEALQRIPLLFNGLITATGSLEGRLSQEIDAARESALAIINAREAEEYAALEASYSGKLDLLRQQHELELQLAEEKLEGLEEAERRHLERMAQLEAEHLARRADVGGAAAERRVEVDRAAGEEQARNETEANKQRGKALAQHLKQGLALSTANSKKAFQLNKVAQLAQATVTGISAAVEAWKWGMSIPPPVGGPHLAKISAAASIAATTAQINAIRAQQFGGGGGSAAPAGGGAATAAASSTGGGEAGPVNQIFLEFRGQGAVSQEDVRDAISRIGEELEEGGSVQVFGGTTAR